MAKRADKTKQPPKQIGQVPDAEYNPRRIGPIADAALKESLFIFGPLDGFVLNLETNSVICGHQRRRHIAGMKPGDIEWGVQHKVNLGPKEKRFISTEINGTFQDEHGNHWGVRAVQWPLWFEQAANISANNPVIQGEFTDDLSALLDGIRDSFEPFEDVGLGLLGSVSARVLAEDFSDLDAETSGLVGIEDAMITVVVPAKHEAVCRAWLANGQPTHAAGLGKGVMARCGLL